MGLSSHKDSLYYSRLRSVAGRGQPQSALPCFLSIMSPRTLLSKIAVPPPYTRARKMQKLLWRDTWQLWQDGILTRFVKLLWPITVLEELRARKKLFSGVFSSQVTAPVPVDVAKVMLSDDTILTAYPCSNTEYYRVRNTALLEEKCFCFRFLQNHPLPMSSPLRCSSFQLTLTSWNRKISRGFFVQSSSDPWSAAFKLFQKHISALIPHACSVPTVLGLRNITNSIWKKHFLREHLKSRI